MYKLLGLFVILVVNTSFADVINLECNSEYVQFPEKYQLDTEKMTISDGLTTTTVGTDGSSYRFEIYRTPATDYMGSLDRESLDLSIAGSYQGESFVILKCRIREYDNKI